MIIKYLFPFFLLVFLLSSCSISNYRPYYFPLEQEDQVVVYQYTCAENPRFTEYWKLDMDPFAEILQTDSYRYNYELYNTFIERYEDSGTVLEEYIDYEYDNKGNRKSIAASILEKDVYQWSGKDPYVFSMNYVNKFGRFDFVKRRTFIGAENIEVYKENYKALKFKDEYFVNAIDQNDKYTFYQICYYVKDIGMVKYERFIPNSGPRVLELERVMSSSEFEKAKRAFRDAEKLEE